MNELRIKETFLNHFDKELVAKIPPFYLAILDEQIEKCLKGDHVINGHAPENDDEWFIVLANSFVFGVTAANGVIEGCRKAYPKDIVNININYRGQIFNYNFSPKPI